MFSISFPSVDSISTEVLKLFLYSVGDLPVGDYPIYQISFLFLTLSVIGWILETVYRSFHARKFINPGFLLGPMVPLYGVGGLFLLYTGIFTAEFPLPAKFMIYFTVLSLLEYVTGEILLLTSGKRYWDYRNNSLNIRGIVCLRFSLYWGVAGLVFEYTISPLVLFIMNHLPVEETSMINIGILSLMGLDFLYSSGIISKTLTLSRIRLKKILSSRWLGDNKTPAEKRAQESHSFVTMIRILASAVTKPVSEKLIYTGTGFNNTGETILKILTGRKRIKKLPRISRIKQMNRTMK